MKICNGHGLNIVLPFLGILFSTMVQEVVSSCGEHICLKWKIQDTKLVLICKVDALNFPITFYDPFNTETGFCVPHKPCISLLDKANITKNSSQHEFIFTIPLKMQLNGWWNCTYGDNIDKSATEVTIQDIPSTNVQRGTDCWILMMLWCFLGFSCSVLLVCLILFVLDLSSGSKDRTKYYALLVGTKYNFLETNTYKEDHGVNAKETEQNSVKNAEKTQNPATVQDGVNGAEKTQKPATDKSESITNKVLKIMILFSVSVTFFVLPLIVGKTEEKDCVAPAAFTVFGATVGIGCCYMLIHKGKIRNNLTEK